MSEYLDEIARRQKLTPNDDTQKSVHNHPRVTIRLGGEYLIEVGDVDQGPMLAIGYDGSSRYAPHFNADEAARAFWSAVARSAPGQMDRMRTRQAVTVARQGLQAAGLEHADVDAIADHVAAILGHPNGEY